MAPNRVKSIAVLTSGGDAPGMNPCIRAVVRAGLANDIKVFGVEGGYQGLIRGTFRPLGARDVGGILQRGGTILQTARSAEFREPRGQREAIRQLNNAEIDALVVIGGDGSLTGASIFRQEWPDLLKELVAIKRITAEKAAQHPHLFIVGLVGSIDNDFYGTDMTIGADSALHRITEAVDAITCTAASHQRTFVVKVMGRNCGYLAVMGALATGADWVLIPESPPDVDNWQEVMCERLRAGRAAGRRDSIVIMAEGARDRHGNYIGSSDVQKALEDALGEEVRITVLGHVQRGGNPSAFDRNFATLSGYQAVETLLNSKPEDEPVVIGIRGNRMVTTPLMYCVEQTRAVAAAVEAKDFEKAVELRTTSFKDAFRTLRTLVRALPHPPPPEQRRLRLAVLNSGAPSPGMNTAVRAAVRLGIDKGHQFLGVHRGFEGFAEGEIEEMNWMSVNGWSQLGGSELGTNRTVPKGSDLYGIARSIEKYEIDGILMIGGWSGYESIHKLMQERANFPAFNIPMVCMPATIDNNLPGTEFSIGADTALNNIVEAVDKIKQSAVATRRVVIVEVMGHYCGYLAQMGGLSTGAERVYIHEEGISLKDLQKDVEDLNQGFLKGKRLGLIIRCEFANQVYTTPIICGIFEEEGGDLYDVRQSILGHLQQGGNPSPFDRIQAMRFAAKSIEYLIEQAANHNPLCAFIGLQQGQIKFHNMEDFTRMVNVQFRRPKEEWWLELRPIAKMLAQPRPSWDRK